MLTISSRARVYWSRMLIPESSLRLWQVC